MPTLPPAMVAMLAPFAPLFSRRVGPHAVVLVVGPLLAPGKRTVTAALRMMGLEPTRRFERDHRVWNRARWSSLAVSRVLLSLLVAAVAPTGPLLLGSDETIERRWGKRITAQGIYRDAVRSSHAPFVKASGRRWMSLMLLVPIPWAGRVWALPFLTALAPSARYDQEHGRRHQTLAAGARQLLRLVRRGGPDRPSVAVADSSYAALDLLAACQAGPQPVTVITRLRLDAALYAPAPPRSPRQVGRPRLKGQRRPTLAAGADDPTTGWPPVTVPDWDGTGERGVEIVSDPAVWYHTGRPPVLVRWVLIRDPHGTFDTPALLCTDLAGAPEQILAWFVPRWQWAVTFEEVRRHLGVETPRQWSELAIRRTTPAVLGRFSLGTLFTQQQVRRTPARVRPAAWYPQARPPFADALALVRRELWAPGAFRRSVCEPAMVKVPRAFIEHLTATLCDAA
jgi:hypothetical protein